MIHIKAWLDSEAGALAMVVLSMIAMIPILIGCIWNQVAIFSWLYLMTVVLAVFLVMGALLFKKPLKRVSSSKGLDHQLIIQLLQMTLLFILLGISAVLLNLEGMAADGLEPPMWLVDCYWAKPAIMIMGLWGLSVPTTCCSTWRH